MSAEYRHLLDEIHELRCRVQELEAENAELRAELEKPKRRPISFGTIEDPRRRR